VCNLAVWLGAALVEKDGPFVHPDLASLDKALLGD
jgi:hypothetical protein